MRIMELDVAVYPYSREFAGFAEYLIKKSSRFQIKALISPNGWGLTGKDGGYALGRDRFGIIVESDFHKTITKCDAVLAVPYHYATYKKETVIENLHLAIEEGKHILCALELTTEEKSKLIKKCEAYHVRFEYYFHTNNVADKIKRVPESLYSPIAPVVFVCNMENRVDSDEVFLSLVRLAKEDGYQVCAIGAKPYCEVAGLHSLPTFFTDIGFSEDFKAIFFNNYIKLLDQEELPDLFIVQLPDGLFKYGNVENSGFAIRSYMIAQTVYADYTVLCLPYQLATGEFYEILSENCKCRFNFKINNVHMMNFYIDHNKDSLNKECYLSSTLIESIAKKYNQKHPSIPMYHQSQLKQLYTNMLEALSSSKR